MERGRVNTFQVKDLFQRLHDTENYLLENRSIKTDPTFEDVIFKKTANDPYYHKNEFNLSQTHHDINYILNPSNQEPFNRPEINSAYIAAHPEGTVPFYPSHLSGEFIDIPKEERIFEKLLLRVEGNPPSDDEIIQNMSKLLKDEQSALDWLRNDIESRMEMLGNVENIRTFQTYFKNMTHWLFTGELNDPNAPIEPFTEPVTISRIDNLAAIHNRIVELDGETRDQIPQLLSEFETAVITTRNTKIEEALVKQLNEEKERKEKARIMNEQAEAYNQKMMELEARKMEFFTKAVELKRELQALVKILNHQYIETIKKMPRKDKRGDPYTINDLLTANPKKDWLTTDKRILLLDEISLFSSRLHEVYMVLDSENKKIKPVLIDIRGKIAEIKDAMLFDKDQQDEEQQLLDFETEFNKLFNDITLKRKENSTYQLIIDFYTKKTPKGLIPNDKTIHRQKNISSSVVYVSSIFSEYIKVEQNIYNDKGEEQDVVTIQTEINDTLEPYYTFVIPDTDGTQKTYVLQINLKSNTSKTLLPISLVEL
jgi:hypothetical protein